MERCRAVGVACEYVGVACGCVGGAKTLPCGAHWRGGGRWAWLVGMWARPRCGRGLVCSVGGVASVWAWLVGSVWAVPQCCPAVLIGVEVVGGRGLWGVWAWPRCGPGFRCSVGVWSDVGVACGCVCRTTVVLIGVEAVGGRGLCVWVWPLCGCGLRCNVRAWSDVAWAWLSVCGRGLIVPI